MPIISMFYGIIIVIYYEDTGRHKKPHIHARYQGKNISISIEDGTILAGKFPKKQLRFVQAWIDIHKDELLANWELAVSGDEPFRIDPLR